MVTQKPLLSSPHTPSHICICLCKYLSINIFRFDAVNDTMYSLCNTIWRNVSLCLQLKDLRDKYSQCEDMLREAREDIKNLRNKSLPNSTVQRYTALASVLPMDSLAAEIEGTFRKGRDNPAPSEYKWVRGFVCMCCCDCVKNHLWKLWGWGHLLFVTCFEWLESKLTMTHICTPLKIKRFSPLNLYLNILLCES